MSQNNTRSSADACDMPSTPYEVALAEILSHITPIKKNTSISTECSLYSIADEIVCAEIDVPGARNSAMDGYACQFADLQGGGEKPLLKLIGTSAAGAPYQGELNAGECIRILTGGVVPNSLDTVIMQEDCEVEDGYVTTNQAHRKGQYIRNAGEDVRCGEVVVARGQTIDAAEYSLLAAIGHQFIRVKKRPKVAFFSTGDELRKPGEPFNLGDVYESNRNMIYALLNQLHVETINLGIVRDNLDAIIAQLSAAAQQADVIITSAGASVGDADFVRQAVESLGELKLWKVAMKPGRPLAFGKIEDCWFFGLPGNPVSVAVTFDKIVKPAIRKLKGERRVKPLELSARSTTPIRKSPGRLEFQRGTFSYDTDGHLVVQSTGNQSSGVLSSMSKANCYIVLPAECGNLDEGATVTVQPFTTEMPDETGENAEYYD